MAFADRPDDQPQPRRPEHPPDRRDQRDRGIDHPVVVEEDRADHRNVGQGAEGHLAGQRRLDPVVALAHQRRQAKPEHRQRQPRCDLVGKDHLGQEGKDQAERRAADGAGKKAQNRAAGPDCGHEAADRADNHHPLDPEVQDARLLDHQLAQRGQHDRDRRNHQRGDEDDRIDAADIHHLTPRIAVRMRKLVSTSTPSRKNRSIP